MPPLALTKGASSPLAPITAAVAETVPVAVTCCTDMAELVCTFTAVTTPLVNTCPMVRPPALEKDAAVSDPVAEMCDAAVMKPLDPMPLPRIVLAVSPPVASVTPPTVAAAVVDSDAAVTVPAVERCAAVTPPAADAVPMTTAVALSVPVAVACAIDSAPVVDRKPVVIDAEVSTPLVLTPAVAVSTPAQLNVELTVMAPPAEMLAPACMALGVVNPPAAVRVPPDVNDPVVRVPPTLTPAAVSVPSVVMPAVAVATPETDRLDSDKVCSADCVD